MVNALNGTTYIVIWELGKDGNSAEIEKLLNSYAAWGKLTENSWVIVSTNSASAAIRDQIKPHIGTNGRLFVIKSGYESAWTNVKAKSEWLKEYLAN